MNILKLYVTFEEARYAFDDFSNYHKHVGISKHKDMTFTYNNFATKVVFGFAKDRDDCFRRYSGHQYQMIDFGQKVEEEVKLYILTKLRA